MGKEVDVCKHFYTKVEPLEFHCTNGALPEKEIGMNLKNKKSLQYDSLSTYFHKDNEEVGT